MVELLNTLNIVFVSILIVWFGLKFIGVPRLVKRTPITEIYKIAIVEFLFIISLVGAILNLTFGEWILLITLIFWGHIQYKNHWYWVSNEPTEKEVLQYKIKYGENITIFKKNEKTLRPDLFHSILHIIALCTFVIIAIRLVQYMTYLPN